MDITDGHAYTRAEFVAEYGGIREWELAKPVQSVQPVQPAAPAVQTEALTVPELMVSLELPDDCDPDSPWDLVVLSSAADPWDIDRGHWSGPNAEPVPWLSQVKRLAARLRGVAHARVAAAPRRDRLQPPRPLGQPPRLERLERRDGGRFS